MPIYEYECPACGKFEVMQKITAEPLEKCETCGKPVRKLVSTTSFALKGSGWYATDYAGAKKGDAAAAAKKSDGDSKASGPAPEKGGDGAATGGSEKKADGAAASGGEKSGGEKSGGEKSGGGQKKADSGAAAKPSSGSGPTGS